MTSRDDITYPPQADRQLATTGTAVARPFSVCGNWEKLHLLPSPPVYEHFKKLVTKDRAEASPARGYYLCW